jgi:hypothetical protein
MLEIGSAITGTILLLAGRKLFWFFVGVSGFIAGLYLASLFVPDTSAWIRILIAVGFGILGAILAVFIQGVAIFIAGFAGGAMVSVGILKLVSGAPQGLEFVVFIIGGIIGGILFTILFDWALVLTSALGGALLITRAIPIPGIMLLTATVILFILGAVVQLRSWKEET